MKSGKSRSTNELPPLPKLMAEEVVCNPVKEGPLRVFGKLVPTHSSEHRESHDPMLMTYHKVPSANNLK